MKEQCYDISTIGNIKEKRLAKNLSQFKAAAYCGVSITAYQRWESGVTKQVFKSNYDKLLELLGD